MITKKRLHHLREVRRYGIGRLLLLARRDFLARLSKKMGDKGGDSQVLSRGRLLPYIDLEGTRSTELAKRMGVSKQAVARLVKELEEEGFLTRTQDDADGRAFLVTFTESGVEYLTLMHDAITQVERDYEREFGAEPMRAVMATLASIAYSGEEGEA